MQQTQPKIFPNGIREWCEEKTGGLHCNFFQTFETCKERIPQLFCLSHSDTYFFSLINLILAFVLTAVTLTLEYDNIFWEEFKLHFQLMSYQRHLLIVNFLNISVDINMGAGEQLCSKTMVTQGEG